MHEVCTWLYGLTDHTSYCHDFRVTAEEVWIGNRYELTPFLHRLLLQFTHTYGMQTRVLKLLQSPLAATY
jgi:hypothetical protein